jgi:Zn/Cd-binding protein ZinT
MKRKRISCLLLSMMLSLSLMTGCGNTKGSQTQETVETSGATAQESTVSEETQEVVDANQAAAEQLLLDLEGSYQELWPILLAEEYDQVWLDNSEKLVGEENAESTVKMLKSMVTGIVIGEEAVETYKDGNMAYCCEFLQGVEQFVFDGNTISGVDADGNEVFKHSYHYIGMEEIRGLYIFESDDEDSGEFTYFCIAPDTMETTWHIEFRYGSNLEALGKYDAGEYAYWLASGIATDCERTAIENSIELFCTENLSE